MHHIGTEFAGHPANLKGRIPDIQLFSLNIKYNWAENTIYYFLLHHILFTIITAD